MWNNLKDKKVILGSGSPRRKELMTSLGVDFQIRVVETDESAPDEYGPSETAIHIARRKILAHLDSIGENEIIITADTEVWLDRRRFGKAQSEDEAREMLEVLAGKSHQVITGFCIADSSRLYSEAVVTEVTFKDLNPEEIDHYIRTFKPYDKAGAYGIQEWIGMIGIERIKGSYFNVVGLPVHEVYQALKSWN